MSVSGPPRIITLLSLVVPVFVANATHAEGLRRIDGAWNLSGRMTAVALAPGDTCSSSAFWLRAAQARLYGQRELPARLISVGAARPVRGVAVVGQWLWESVGSAALRDDRLLAQFEAGRLLKVGLRFEAERLTPGPGPALKAQRWDATVSASGSTTGMGIWTAHLAIPMTAREQGGMTMGRRPLLLLQVAGSGRALAFSVDARAGGGPAPGWEAMMALAGGVGVSWRADQGSGALGFGIVVQRDRYRLRTSHLAHPDLDVTHRIEIGLGRTGASPW